MFRPYNRRKPPPYTRRKAAMKLLLKFIMQPDSRLIMGFFLVHFPEYMNFKCPLLFVISIWKSGIKCRGINSNLLRFGELILNFGHHLSKSLFPSVYQENRDFRRNIFSWSRLKIKASPFRHVFADPVYTMPMIIFISYAQNIAGQKLLYRNKIRFIFMAFHFSYIKAWSGLTIYIYRIIWPLRQKIKMCSFPAKGSRYQLNSCFLHLRIASMIS